MLRNGFARTALCGALLVLAGAASAADVPQTGTTGACCLPSGDCIPDIPEQDCIDAGGTWAGADIPCANAGCETITGGCCLPDGTCLSLTEEDCNAEGGTSWAPGVDCGNACPGACCLLEGIITACQDLGQVDCESLGGFFQGNGTDCTNTNCVAFGACCYPSGACGIAFPEECAADGGVYQGDSTDCASVSCPQPGACCLADGSCFEGTADECAAASGVYQGDGIDCASANCPQPTGACCFADGSCAEQTEADCTGGGGAYSGDGVDCASANCPQPTGACCLPDGSCTEVTADECAAASGTYQGNFVACGGVSCPQPTGACCLADGSCLEGTADECAAASGTYQGDFSDCGSANCPQPTGACCFPNGTCSIQTADDCAAAGGTYSGDGTGCVPNECEQPPPAVLVPRMSHTEKGSVLIFPRVEVGFDANGDVVHDTFVCLTNDYPGSVRVLMYFVNGDEPLAETPTERAHTGWNFLDNEITLTANQPACWSAATGLGTVDVTPWEALDPGDPKGRVVPGYGYRLVRGMIYAIAIDANGNQISWNHLAGSAKVLSYEASAAGEYGAAAFQALGDLEPGTPVGVPGVINLDGVEYADAYNQLLYNFQAHGSAAMSNMMAQLVVANPEATLQPASIDVRVDDTEGPITTKASFDVWNENEVKFSGAHRCVTCWDQTFLLFYQVPNHFTVPALQTDFGKARIDGLGSQLCPDSIAAALVGLSMTWLSPDGNGNGNGDESVDSAGIDLSATLVPMFGMGHQTATIKFDPLGPPDESPAAPAKPTKLGFTTGR